MLTAPDRDVRKSIVGIMRAVAILAAVGLLAGCPGHTGYGSTDSGGNNVPVVHGNGFGSDGGDAHGGDANGRDANGRDANGRDGVNGSDGADGDTGGDGGTGSPGSDGAPGTAGAPGSGNASSSVAGSGHLTSQLIALPGVTSVAVESNFVVHLTMGEPEQATIRIDDNLTDLIDATVTDGALRLGLKPGSNVRNATLSAEVTVRHLDRLSASGASEVTLVSPPTGSVLQLDTSGSSQITGPVRVDHVEAAVSGAGRVALSGQVASLQLSGAGNSRLVLADLAVRDLNVVLSGASRATVRVSDTLAAETTGASELRYRGTPNITRQQTSGASSITPDSR